MKIESINPLLLGEDPLVFDATKALKTEAVPAKNELGNRETRSDQGRYHVLPPLLPLFLGSYFFKAVQINNDKLSTTCPHRFFASLLPTLLPLFWEAIFSKPFRPKMTNSAKNVRLGFSRDSHNVAVICQPSPEEGEREVAQNFRRAGSGSHNCQKSTVAPTKSQPKRPQRATPRARPHHPSIRRDAEPPRESPTVNGVSVFRQQG